MTDFKDDQLLGLLLETSIDNIFIIDAGGRFQRVSTGGARALGFSPEKVVGHTWRELGLPEVPFLEVEAQWNRVIETGSSSRNRVFYSTPDGEVLYEYEVFPIRSGVETVGATIVSRDITEQAQSEEEVLRSQERYRSFVANSSEGIWRFELELPIDCSLSVDEQLRLSFERGYLAECNDAMARMYGYGKAEEIVGAPLGNFLPPDVPSNLEFLEAFLAGGYRLEGAESVEVDRFGATKHFVNSFIGIVENGMLLRAWGTQRDVTAQTRVYQQALEASRAKDEFLATLSHELRTPVTSILGWASVLRVGEQDSETVRAGIESIEKSARTQAALIDDLLDVSRIITGKFRLEVEPLDPRPIVESVVDSVRHAQQGKQLKVSIQGDAIVVSADPNRLQQILWNLLSNAVKFSTEGGSIGVAIERDREWGVIRVSDRGRGLSEGELPRVFDRFWQADASNTRTAGGMGLGLAIVKYLTELHGGTVAVRSQGLGHGATFEVRLPLAPLASRH